MRPKQSLGQNFLVDDNIVRNIIRELSPRAEDVMVEVGPGTGALTSLLAGKVNRLILIEIDQRMVDDLRAKFSSPSVTVFHQDFLETDIRALAEEFGRPLRIAGNLPYHVSSQILFHCFEAADVISDLTIMLQREVARRIVAPPGNKEYGILSVMTRFYGRARLLFDVSPNCFYPKPDVVSTVLQIRLGGVGAGLPVEPKLFSTVVRTAFGKRRKTLRNSLRYLPFDESLVESMLSDLPIPLDRRAEQLTMEEFTELTRHIAPYVAGS